MKKLLTFLTLCLAFTFYSKAQTTMQITWVDDSLGNYCSVPAAAYLGLGGNATGYNWNTDSATIYIDFGDGNDTTFKVPLWGQGSQGGFWAGVNYTYTSAGIYSPKYIVTMPDGVTDTVCAPNSIIVSTSCGNISGQVYLDNNSNCTYDNGTDDPAQSQMILLKESSSGTLVGFTYTSTFGYYNFLVPTGVNYDIEVNTNLASGFTITCPTGGSYTTTAPASGQDFALECQPGFDLQASGFANGFVPGTTTGFVNLAGLNLRCLPTNGQLKLVVSNPLVTFQSGSSQNPPDSIVGDTIYWSFSNLAWGSGFFMQSPNFYTDTTATIGDTICFDLYICPETGDVDLSNNHIQICAPVVTSYDPNNKVVSPLGVGNTGNIAVNQTMTYTINFQNTGTAPAINIYLMDTIDVSTLNMETFNVVATSHNMTDIRVFNGNELRFEFDNINLPDSLSNEPASKGWVTYTIDQMPNLPIGTTIENSASIYFDYNLPVKTNTTLNTIYEPVVSVPEVPVLEGNLAKIYPNPTATEFTVELTQDQVGVYRLFDLTGKQVQTGRINNGLERLEVQHLQSGMYLLHLESANSVQVEQVVIQR